MDQSEWGVRVNHGSFDVAHLRNPRWEDASSTTTSINRHHGTPQRYCEEEKQELISYRHPQQPAERSKRRSGPRERVRKSSSKTHITQPPVLSQCRQLQNHCDRQIEQYEQKADMINLQSRTRHSTQSSLTRPPTTDSRRMCNHTVSSPSQSLSIV